jgi:hypothetical protein
MGAFLMELLKYRGEIGHSKRIVLEGLSSLLGLIGQAAVNPPHVDA